MRKSLFAVGIVAALASLGVVVPGHAQPALVGSGQTTCMMNGSASPDGGIVTWSPAAVWPPNHKFHAITINYYESGGPADPTAEPTETLSASVNQSMVTDSDIVNGVEKVGSGSPNNNPDWQQDPNSPPTTGTDTGNSSNPATFTEDIRAERSGTDGNGSGRLYMIPVQCNDTLAGGVMEPMGGGVAMVTVCVPHDMSEASRNFCLANVPQPPTS